MANEGERSISADKGKGKVDDIRELNGKKPQKDEKTPAEGKKKDDEPQEGKSQQRCPGVEHVVSIKHSFDFRIVSLTSLKKSSVRKTSN